MKRRKADEARLLLAHELRTPLTSLGLGVGLLENGTLGELSVAQREVVAQLALDVARLREVVDASLDIERLGAYAGPVRRRVVELASLVRAAAAPIVRQSADQGVAIAWRDDAEVRVNVDPAKLAWVAVSLIGNALRFSPKGGAIGVEIRERGGEAELSVSDAGPGMSVEARGRVLDAALGRGLGLPLANEIVEAHGGSLVVASSVGKGTTIRVRLPLAPRDP